MSVTSSPFVENPLDRIPSNLDKEQIISKLEFQISSAKTEQRLLTESKNQLSEKYEDIIKKKNEEIEALKLNFEYLYNQRDSINSKLSNSEQIANKTIDSLNETTKAQTVTISKLENENYKLSSKMSKIMCQREQEQNSLKYLEDENAQLHERLEELNVTNERLSKENYALQTKLSERNSSNLESSQSYHTLNESLRKKNELLQKTNNSLQLKLDQLLQQKISVELLRQKNMSLQGKLDALESAQERLCKVEIENMELKSKYQEYIEITKAALIDVGSDKTNSGIDQNSNDSAASLDANAFITSYRNLQNNNLIIQDKFNQALLQIDQFLIESSKLKNEKKNELLPTIKSLNGLLDGRQELIEKLEKQKLLNVKEIEFLRELLKSLDTLTPAKTEDPNQAAQVELQRFQKLLEIANGENQALQIRVSQLQADSQQQQQQQQQQEQLSRAEISFKRKKEDQPEDEDVTIYTAHLKLEQENTKLLSSIKSYKDSISSLQAQIVSLEQVQTKKQKLKVLQLRSNHISRDQAVKQETLDLLRKENQDLISNITGDTFPRSVFERQENDKQNLQVKIDQLAKRITRLREVYSKKSCDILLIISKFFGYSVEFLPSPINPEDLSSSRIKLVSKYLNQSSNDRAYLVIDVHSKVLKANGNEEFKNLCQELVTNWVNGKDQIPCFLGALNLSLYELQQQ